MVVRHIQVGDFRIGREEKKAVNDVLDSGRISEGRLVRKFEEEWAKFCGVKYCVAVNSGTSAVQLGLEALKHYKSLKPGTKVITTPLTFIATVNAIVKSGLEPVFVDVDRTIFDITPENISDFLSKKKNGRDVKIILPVHLMGYMALMDEINRIAAQYNLFTFEDSAQAHGSCDNNGRKAGSLSLASSFSFYIAHNIQAGEMGALVTNNEQIYKIARKLKAHGRICDCPVCARSKGKCPHSPKGRRDLDPRFTHDLIGFNFKTMEFQAALALTQMKRIESIIARRQEIVSYLNAGLAEFSHYIDLPVYSKDVSYLAYPLVVKGRISRRILREELEKNGIETRPLFGCIPTQQPAYAYLKDEYEGRLPNADYLGNNGFYIGCHQYLEKDDLDYIINVFSKILG